MTSREQEARGVTRNGKILVIILIEQEPHSTTIPRFKAWIEDTGEVLASGLLYATLDAAVDCWLDGYAHGYDSKEGANHEGRQDGASFGSSPVSLSNHRDDATPDDPADPS